MDRVVERETVWHIMEKTEEGRLVEPLSRQQYDCCERNPFDRNGYASMELAELEIERYTINKEDDYNTYVGFGEPVLYNGETSDVRCNFFIIPECRVRVFRRKRVVE